MRAAPAPKNIFKGTGEDPFLRKSTRPRTYNAFQSLPLSGRLCVSFVIGFAVGAVLEVFICKTHLYEFVMARKTGTRHSLDEFAVEFRSNMLKWQQEDMQRAAQSTKQSQ